MSRLLRSLKLTDVGLLALAALVVMVCVLAIQHARPNSPPPGASLLPPPPPREPVVLVVGDSFVGGSDMNSGPTWPTLMGAENDWVMATEAVGGTGFVNGANNRTAFPDRVAKMPSYTPDVVVIGGGINDVGRYPTSEIVEAASTTVKRLSAKFPEAEVVLLSPFSSATVSESTVDLRTELRKLARADAAGFVNVSDLFEGREDLIGSDMVHPTDGGHALLARVIGDALQPIVRQACQSRDCRQSSA